MEFVRHNQKLITATSIITIILVVVFNALYYIFAPIQSQGDPENFVATPILERPIQTTTSAIINQPQPTTASLISLSILLVIVLLLIVIIFAALKYQGSQRQVRDRKRRADLKRLAQAFEAYHQEHGQYPLSTTYQPQYYTGINLSNDWNYYGLPDKEHMVRYLPEWPLSDPSIDYNAKHQVNQYIYYPKENGQKFFLYAHLESPSNEEQIDYNQQDNLLRSWGSYNYRISSSQEQPSEINHIPHPQHAKSEEPAHAPAPLAPTPPAPPSTTTTTTPTYEIPQPLDTPPTTSAIPAAPTAPIPPQSIPATSSYMAVTPSLPQAPSPQPSTPTATMSPTNNVPNAAPLAMQPNMQPNLSNQAMPASTAANDQLQVTPAPQASPQPMAINPSQSAPVAQTLAPESLQSPAQSESVIAAMPLAEPPNPETNQLPDINPESNQPV